MKNFLIVNYEGDFVEVMTGVTPQPENFDVLVLGQVSWIVPKSLNASRET